METGKIKYVQFGILSSAEILGLSVVEVYQSSTKMKDKEDPLEENHKKTKSRENTPYDERMGVLEKDKKCLTCGKGTIDCPGHFGHIILPFPIYSLQFLPTVVKILQCICPFCSRPRIHPDHARLRGLLAYKRKTRLTMLAKESVKIQFCPWSDCAKFMPQYDLAESKTGIKTFYPNKGKSQAAKKKRSTEFSESECLAVLMKISNEHVSFLGFNDDLLQDSKFDNVSNALVQHAHQFRPENLIFTVFPVLPPTSRPYTIRDGKVSDDDLTENYNNIVKKRKQYLEGKDLKPRARQKLVDLLKLYVWTLIDNTKEGCKLSNGGRPNKCIKQRIKGKDGRVQNNVSGKRTDQSGRSVVSPGGIYLEADEIGVPQVIASGLTTKEYVLPQNIHELQDLVKLGQVKRVIRGDNIIRLDTAIYEGKKFILQIGDVAERVLKDKDYFDNVIFNRQPTLRVESMSAFRVKVIGGFAWRLPLCYTPNFGADFDGDNLEWIVENSF